jgi:WD40 repeat protein
LSGYESAVRRVAFACGGKVLAASSKEHLILWEVPAGKLLSKHPGVHLLGKHGVAALNTSPDSGRMQDGSIHLLDLNKRKTTKTWRIATGDAYWPTLSVDGEQLALLVIDNEWKAVVLNLATLTERISFQLPGLGMVHSLAISPDNRILAVGSGSDVCIWDLQSGKLRDVLARASEGDGEADV